MKHVLTLILIFVISAVHAQLQMGLHYCLSAPLGAMGQNIQPIHNFEMMGCFNLKSDRQFYIGAELSFGSYAHTKQQQTYISPDDGSMTMTDVDFSSNTQNYHAMARYEFTQGATLIPYVTVKAGVSVFNTSIVIQDPDDHHSCHPLDEETAFSDVAFSAGMGAGFKLDASSIFTKWNKGRTWFDFSASYLFGTPIDYINVRYLTPGSPGPNTPTGEVNAEFIDLHTQHIHEHQIAQVYTSSINLLDFKIGIVKTFGWCQH